MHSRPIPLLALACTLILGCAPGSGMTTSARSDPAAAPAALRTPAAVPHLGLPRAEPEEVGLSGDVLARIGPATQAYVDSGRVAGVLVAVARQGRVAFFETFGHADLERGVPLAPDAVFRIYSMTKPVTAVATMRLVEQGRIRLDDPVSRYIPAFAGVRVYAAGGASSPATVPAERPITIQDLLAHTSGLPYGLGSTPADTIAQAFDLFRASRTLEGFADSIARLPLSFQPGDRWGYGPGLEVLGRVIEVVSGRPFDRYLEEEIFRPLGMNSTSFRLDPPLRARVATVYEPGEDQRLRPVRDLLAADNFEPGARFLCGGCGLLSTAPDYLRFAQMLLNGGELDGVRILRAETVASMRTNVLPPEHPPILGVMGPGYGHGLGVGVQVGPPTPDHPTPPGTFGWAGAANTYVWIDPEHDIVLMVWTQHFPTFAHPRMRMALKSAVYTALAADVAASPAAPSVGVRSAP